MSQKKLVFKGGTVVLPDRAVNACLVVEDGVIAGITLAPPQGGYEVVDVSGKVLLPGAVDTHVHIKEPTPFAYREDWFCGSQAAAAGGISTIVQMPATIPPITNKAGFEAVHSVASAYSFVDFALWGGMTPDCIGNMAELDSLGCVAYKAFLSFASPTYPSVTDSCFVDGLREAAKFGGLVGVHAENAELADIGGKRMLEQGCQDEAMHDDSRPWWVEYEAIQRAVLFAEVTRSRLYICHLSAAESARFLKDVKGRGGAVGVETCPHYLVFDKNIYRSHKTFARCNPPMRSGENREKLWEYVFDGTIDTIGTDHGPYSDEEQEQGSFWKGLPGFGSFDVLLPVMVGEGVVKRGLSLHRLAAITSGNAARLMGLFPRKGNLLPGADADIVVMDLNREWVYDGTKTFSKTKSSRGVYHGRAMRGKVDMTFVRGSLVYDGETITGRSGYGQYVPRQRPDSADTP